MKIARIASVLVAAASLAFVSGCAQYYQVSDPGTKQVYYTSELRRLDNGAVSLVDGSTGNTVTIQNSDVRQIDKDQYEQGLRADAAKTVAPPTNAK